MKQLFVIMLLLSPFVGSSQTKTDTVPFIGAKKIIVKTDSSAKAGFLMLGNILLDNGYTIDLTDNVLFIIKTKNGSSNPDKSYYLNIQARDNYIIITGKQNYYSVLFELFEKNSKPIENLDIVYTKKSKRSERESFDYMNLFAKRFNNPLTYSN